MTDDRESLRDAAEALVKVAAAISDWIQAQQRSLPNLATKTDLLKLGLKIMSQITDWAAVVQTSLDKVSADLDSITADIAALNALIQQLQNSPGTLGPADQAALDKISAAASALATKADAVVPPVVPPAPAP